MVVIVDARRDGRVVVVPLTSINFSIPVAVAEVGEELQEHLVFGHLTRDDLRVHGGRVDALQVSGFNGAVTVTVKLKERFVDHCLTFWVAFALQLKVSSWASVSPILKRFFKFTYSDADQEFIKVDAAITIKVEQLKERLYAIS